MDAKKLIELRKQAEAAVEGMTDGDLKVKAFEVILAHLLGGPAGAFRQPVSDEADDGGGGEGREVPGSKSAKARGLVGRILVLREEGFFRNQRTLSDLQQELRAHGWHYPQTTLSPTLLSLARQSKLRRELLKHGNKKVWKYSNP